MGMDASFRLTETLLPLDQEQQVAYNSFEDEDGTLSWVDCHTSGFRWPIH